MSAVTSSAPVAVIGSSVLTAIVAKSLVFEIHSMPCEGERPTTVTSETNDSICEPIWCGVCPVVADYASPLTD